jgi:hypothetical protein
VYGNNPDRRPGHPKANLTLGTDWNEFQPFPIRVDYRVLNFNPVPATTAKTKAATDYHPRAKTVLLHHLYLPLNHQLLYNPSTKLPL